MGPPVFPQELISMMSQGECALLLGHEGIIATNPLAPNFGKYLTDGQPRERALPSIFALAQSYESRHGRQVLIRKVEEYVTQMAPNLEPIYHCLSEFSLRYIISTNVDTRLETILRNQGLSVLSVLRNEDVASAANDDSVKVVKLFGSIAHPDTLILTERDLIDLPEKSSRIFELVAMALAIHPFLIVGQLLHDFHFRRLYRRLILGGRFHRSYALCSYPGEDLEYWTKKNVQIVSGNEERLLRYIASFPPRQSEPISHRQPAPQSRMALEPYKFLDYFESEDANIFFGRKDDTNRCSQKILSHRLTVLCGKSGVGKTSLIKAGISPLLSGDGRYQLIYARCGEDPSRSVKRALIDLEPSLGDIQSFSGGLADFLGEARRIMRQEFIILIDQFEELFIKFGEEVHSHFLRELMQCLTGSSLTVRFVLSLREDYLGRLADLRDIVPMIFYNVYRLKELTLENAKDAIVEPARAFGIDFEQGLPEAILKDIGATEVAPPQIQIVCYKLYQSLGEATTITHSLYKKLGGIKQILSDYLDESLAKFGEKAEPVKSVLKAMVTSEGTKSLLSLSDISVRASLTQVLVEQILDNLVNNQRLVRKMPGDAGFQFELAHEYLTFKIWQWFGEEDIRQKEIQELMERELNSWRRFRHLRLGKDKLDIFNKGREALKLDKDIVELLLLSSIKHSEDGEYWIDQIREMDVEKQDQIATSIMNIFSDSHLILRRQAAEALASIGNQPLLRALDHHDPNWRCAAIEMVGGLGIEGAVATLISALDDASDEVRALACGALGETGKSIRAKTRYPQTEDSETINLILKSIRTKLVWCSQSSINK
jgi:SIR2-like domain/HEAT repeats